MALKAKYERGWQIRTMCDFSHSNARFFRVLFGEGHERTIHRGFLESWQYHTLDMFIKRGWVYEAETIKQ